MHYFRRVIRGLITAAFLSLVCASALQAGYLFTFSAPAISPNPTMAFPALTIQVTLPELFDGVGIWNFTGSDFAALNPQLTGGAPGTSVDSLEIHRNVGFDEASFGVLGPIYGNAVVYRFQDSTVTYDAPGFFLQADSILQGYSNPGVLPFEGTLEIEGVPEPSTIWLAGAGLLALLKLRKR